MTLFKHSRFLCCSIPSFGVSKTSPKNSSSFNISATSAIIFIKCRNRYHLKNNIRYKVNISVIMFLIRSWLNKTPSDGTCLGEPPGGFCDVGCCWCCCWFLPHWRFFISLLFDVTPHLSVSYHQVFTPILYFQPSSSQSDSRHFHFNFSRLFIFHRECFECFLPTVLFTPHSFVCDSDEGRNTPSRIFLCACPHRVVPSGWRMDLNYWCLNYKAIDISVVPVSHEV